MCCKHTATKQQHCFMQPKMHRQSFCQTLYTGANNMSIACCILWEWFYFLYALNCWLLLKCVLLACTSRPTRLYCSFACLPWFVWNVWGDVYLCLCFSVVLVVCFLLNTWFDDCAARFKSSEQCLLAFNERSTAMRMRKRTLGQSKLAISIFIRKTIRYKWMKKTTTHWFVCMFLLVVYSRLNDDYFFLPNFYVCTRAIHTLNE